MATGAGALAQSLKTKEGFTFSRLPHFFFFFFKYIKCARGTNHEFPYIPNFIFRGKEKINK
jgi:hypothetical protein